MFHAVWLEVMLVMSYTKAPSLPACHHRHHKGNKLAKRESGARPKCPLFFHNLPAVPANVHASLLVLCLATSAGVFAPNQGSSNRVAPPSMSSSDSCSTSAGAGAGAQASGAMAGAPPSSGATAGASARFGTRPWQGVWGRAGCRGWGGGCACEHESTGMCAGACKGACSGTTSGTGSDGLPPHTQ